MEKAFEALPSETKYASWRLYQAGIYADLNKLDEALAACDKAIADAPAEQAYIKASALLKKAEVLLKTKKNEEALAVRSTYYCCLNKSRPAKKPRRFLPIFHQRM
jgi:hypothetical protein